MALSQETRSSAVPGVIDEYLAPCLEWLVNDYPPSPNMRTDLAGPGRGEQLDTRSAAGAVLTAILSEAIFVGHPLYADRAHAPYGRARIYGGRWSRSWPRTIRPRQRSALRLSSRHRRPRQCCPGGRGWAPYRPCVVLGDVRLAERLARVGALIGRMLLASLPLASTHPVGRAAALRS